MSARLTLGPVLYNWAADELRDFYLRVADEAPVDSVCLGEVVCAKRAPLFEPFIAEVAGRLERAGKEVVLSTLALVMDDRDLAAVRAAASDAPWLVEANDIACVSLLEGRPHAIGPFVNVYNEGTLAYLVERGAARVCLPAELPARALAALARATTAELEVQAFGRLPLAISARCYHARSRGLSKDGCQYVCEEDPDGMDVFSLDGEPFLAVNGTQTLSFAYCNLLFELAALEDMGIVRYRLWPHRVDMVAVAEIFRGVLGRRIAADEATARLAGMVGGAGFANGFFHGREGVAFVSGE
ncbi:MAG: U32 family peptidase [Proteobacteria bacterium]|nr:U32 family peptidase [Pseudomonadota bacterium]